MKSFFVEMFLLMGAQAPVSFDEAVVLGQGLTDAQTLTSSCIRGEVERQELYATHDYVSRLLPVKEMRLALGGGSSKLESILSEPKASAEFKLRFMLESQVGQERLVNLQWALPGSLKTPDAATCGTRYIKAMSLGGRLLVAMKFKLRSPEALIRFKKETQIDEASLLTVAGSLQRVLKSDGEISLQLMQIGGHPERLNQLIQTSGMPLSCAIARPAACVNLIQKVVRYSASPDGFWGQLQEAWKSGKSDSLAVLGIDPKAYDLSSSSDSSGISSSR